MNIFKLFLIRLWSLVWGPVQFIDHYERYSATGICIPDPYSGPFNIIEAIDSVASFGRQLYIESMILLMIYVICVCLCLFIYKKNSSFLKNSIVFFGKTLFILGIMGLVSRCFLWMDKNLLNGMSDSFYYGISYYPSIQISFIKDIIWILTGLIHIKFSNATASSANLEAEQNEQNNIRVISAVTEENPEIVAVSPNNSTPPNASNDVDDTDSFNLKEFAATTIANAIIENKNIKLPETGDSEYGLIPSKPIYTAFIEGQEEYLHSLRTLEGEVLTWQRKGSMAVEGVNGIVDIYETYLPSGELYKTLYLNMYSTETSKIPPDGFKMHTNIKAPAQPKCAPSAPVSSASPVAPTTAPAVRTKQRFCKYCGGSIDPETKKCTSCGKQFFRLPKVSFGKLIVIIVVLAAIFGIGGFFIYNHNNYNKGIEAINNQQFILAQKYFDSLIIKNSSYADEYAYIEAGVLMETGDYLESFLAFNKLNTPVPNDIINDLKKHIYDDGVTAYRNNDLKTARKHFTAIIDYSRSEDYLFLINNFGSYSYSYPSTQTYNRLISLLNFEDAAELMASNSYCLQKFLVGRWETTSSSFYYFEIEEKEDGYRSWFNLPRESFYGKYYEISDGIYHQTNDDGDSRKFYRFSIINKDTIDVYCYKDNNTYRLIRK